MESTGATAIKAEGDAPPDGRFANGSATATNTRSTAVTSGSSVQSVDATRDTLFTGGPVDHYFTDLDLTVTLVRTWRPTTRLNVVGLGLPEPIGKALRRTTHPSVPVHMFERITMSRAHNQNYAVPAVPPDAVAVEERPPGDTAVALGQPLVVPDDDFKQHRVLNFGVDHEKTRILFDDAVARLNGSTDGAAGRPPMSVRQLVEQGTRGLDGLRYGLSVPMFNGELRLMLRQKGFDLPEFAGDEGRTGRFNIQVALLNPRVRGPLQAGNEWVEYNFVEYNENKQQSRSQVIGLGSGQSGNTGDLADQSPVSHAQQTLTGGTGVNFSTSTARSDTAVLKTMPQARARRRDGIWERVVADALVTITAPGGDFALKYLVRNFVELGLAPEAALRLHMHDHHRIMVPSGIFVPGRTAA